MDTVLTPAQIARVCYEANRAHCMNIGDHSKSTWDLAQKWVKEGLEQAVIEVLEDPNRPPETNHERWMAVKEEAGWKHGPVVAPDLKEHPCMLPYDQLPDSEKIKDSLFLAIVNALKPLTLESQVKPSKKPREEPKPKDPDVTMPGTEEVEALAKKPEATGEEDLPEAEIIEDKPKKKPKKRR